MRVEKTPYHQTKSFSKFIIDYISGDKSLAPFYNRLPNLENFKAQIQEKQKQPVNRKVLVESLNQQYGNLVTTEIVKVNIQSLAAENTFTVATGHQICLFTGPLYFIYKIISTLNLAEKLNKQFKDKHFVPVFWMASEDHDFEEINHVNLFGKKISWNTTQKGAVGRMSLDNFDSVLNELDSILGSCSNSNYLSSLFRKAYSQSNLVKASRYLVNELFGKYGLVVIDGDDVLLKEKLSSIIKNDIEKSKYFETISKTSGLLSKHYKKQSNVREINFFELNDNSRKRIDSNKKVDLSNYCYSPNVLMRPLYQEILLPNIAYVGGPSEIAYWMQLKDFFDFEKIVFPMLVLRNSALIVDDNKHKKIKKLDLNFDDLFLSEHEIQKSFVLKNTAYTEDFTYQNKLIEELFGSLANKYQDSSIKSSIDAEKSKCLKSFDNLSKKLLKHEKNKHSTSLNQITNIKKSLFPHNSSQERFDNFIPFYLKYGDGLFDILKSEFDPLDTNFVILAH